MLTEPPPKIIEVLEVVWDREVTAQLPSVVSSKMYYTLKPLILLQYLSADMFSESGLSEEKTPHLLNSAGRHIPVVGEGG